MGDFRLTTSSQNCSKELEKLCIGMNQTNYHAEVYHKNKETNKEKTSNKETGVVTSNSRFLERIAHRKELVLTT